MPTVFVSTNGNDANSYVQAQSPATPWAHPLKANASATAADTVSIADGTYAAESYTGAPTFYSFTKLLSYFGTLNTFLESTSSLYTTRISSSLPAGALSFSSVNVDAKNIAAKCIEIGDPVNLWTITQTSCTFANAASSNYNVLLPKQGAYRTINCTFSGSPSTAAITAGTILSATASLTIEHINPNFNLRRNGDIIGLTQLCTSVVNAVSYIVSGATGNIETTSTSASAQGITLRCPGAKIRNGNNLTVRAPDANSNSAYCARIYPDQVNITDGEITGNKFSFLAPGGYAISWGDTSTVSTGTLTGGVVDGNNIVGAYYSSKTPHGILIGRATTISSCSGNLMASLYACYLASRTTSGSGYGNTSKDSYGVDYYAKGATAFTWAGNTAVQTGKYARRNLAPFSIDSQGGVLNVAGSMLYNTYICAEVDFSRVGAMANITINNSGTYTGNTYIIPDTWDTDTTNRFFVGGVEGGRSGATGYTIDEWITGTAGSVSATNGTGTIAISGERVIRLPISEILNMTGSGSSSGFKPFPEVTQLPLQI